MCAYVWVRSLAKVWNERQLSCIIPVVKILHACVYSFAVTSSSCMMTSCTAPVTHVGFGRCYWLHLPMPVLQHFWPAVAEGSWLMKVHGASHNTFLHASWLVDKLLDVLCKRGSTSHQVQYPAGHATSDCTLACLQVPVCIMQFCAASILYAHTNIANSVELCLTRRFSKSVMNCRIQ